MNSLSFSHQLKIQKKSSFPNLKYTQNHKMALKLLMTTSPKHHINPALQSKEKEKAHSLKEYHNYRNPNNKNSTKNARLILRQSSWKMLTTKPQKRKYNSSLKIVLKYKESPFSKTRIQTIPRAVHTSHLRLKMV